MTSPAEAELLALLPPKAAAVLLVDNYFDRVHWFMLLFHQSDFRVMFQQLYEGLDDHNRPQSSGLGLGFVSAFAAVCLVSLRYIDARHKVKLSESGVQPDALQQELLMALRIRLLDIVSKGSIEAVQVCVLVGSFHLYHGEPELAWPICGCGLRIAQALNLHRQFPQRENASSPPDLDDPRQRTEEARKRCWWTVYEIETTCSMLWGFPLSINDDDCDVQFLNPYPLRSSDPSWDATVWQQTGQATLLSYKHAMGRLSVIIKSALTDLYGLRQRRHTNRNTSATDKFRLQELVANVTSLDRRLHEWHTRLPLQLRSTSPSGASPPRTSSNETDGQKTEVEFRNRLFQLQALALKVAFENAKIMIHRPLLSYRISVPPAQNTTATIPSTSDTCQSSIQVCRDAALEISNIGSLPIFQGIADTYAVSFVSLRLLTAGIALSILTTLSPLTQESHDCKMGIRRLMEMQSRLSARSIVAEQGLGILKKLMELVLTKEMKEMLEFPRQPSEDEPEAGTVSVVEVGGDNDLNGVSQNTQEHRAFDGERHEAPQTALSPNDQTTVTTSAEAGAMLMTSDDTSSGTSLDFNFYEDPTITQALLDFEQGTSTMSSP